MTTHTHEYKFWHTHDHEHRDESKGLSGWEPETEDYYTYKHDTGHYHLWAQTHSHGEGIKMPHTHKDKQVHPDESFVHHHADIDHKPLDFDCADPRVNSGVAAKIVEQDAEMEKRQALAASLTGINRVRNSIMITEETFNDEEEMLLASEAYDAEIFEEQDPDRFKKED